MDKYILEIKDLKKYYKLPRKKIFESPKFLKAVNGVSFKVERGETFGLVGESGCGKSTVGQTIVRLHNSTEGNIIFNGRDITNISGKPLKELRKDLQIIFQDPYSSLNPKKKIGWILEEPLKVHKISGSSERKSRVFSMLEKAGFDKSFASRYPGELSGGQRQRIAILVSLMLNPELIIADEPVSALDVSVQSQILNLMKDLQKDMNLTYIFISHDLNVIYYMSDKIAVMYLGEIVEYGDSESVYKNPKHPYTVSLFSAIPDLDNKDKKRIILSGDIPDPVNPPQGCPFYTRCPYVMDKCKTVKPE
ncbi:MAG TPA: ATP-binding cassette domain-containing protein [Tepiditoga sp.]|nr:ATP-binding cassette domain-containing protein [Tepiditoga sp.]